MKDGLVAEAMAGLVERICIMEGREAIDAVKGCDLADAAELGVKLVEEGLSECEWTVMDGLVAGVLGAGLLASRGFGTMAEGLGLDGNAR